MTYKFTKTVGPNAAANTDSEWLRLDNWAGGEISFQAVLTGSGSYSILTTNDDPNDLINPVANPVWDTALTGVVGATANTYGTINVIATYMKATLLSGTGKVALTIIQSE
jgi:hypothetical protein